MFEQILSYFRFNTIEIVAMSLLLFFFIVILFYYLFYYRKPYIAAKEGDNSYALSDEHPLVSLVIVSENEVDSLKDNLPLFLTQDYKNYEVIVVNNGSTDESDELLRSLELQYPNLYHTYLPYSEDRKLARNKLALTLGFKAAKGEILLLTEPYCKPVSNKWISSIISKFAPGKDIVLGYSYYKKEPHFYNRIARFDNLFFSMQYLSMAIKNDPYTGVYRNLAFKKHLFFDNKGFASLLNLENGEEIFVNQIMTQDNTAVALSHDSFIETKLEHYSLWRRIKKSYSLAKGHFKNKTAIMNFRTEIIFRYAFYILFAGVTAYSIMNQHWALLGISIFLFLLNLITRTILFNKLSSYFHSGRFRFSFIVMDILQPLYNFKMKSWSNGRVKANK